MTTKLDAALAAIDAANARDPHRDVSDGVSTPAAMLYGHRMSAMLQEFVGTASDELQIAARGQHIERWQRPRADYPDGRVGYLQWRKAAGEFHATRIAEIMAAAGYDAAACGRAGAIARKAGIKSDAEVQTLEDVACLVFMRWYFAPFAPKRTPAELFAIVEKTARKMSAEGRAAALKLPLPQHLVPAIQAAGNVAS